MKEFVLNYYPKFSCIASECRHTCCAGWKINIDEKTLNLYKGKNDEFSATLHKGINFKKSCFNVDKKGRCAFLNENGLCDLITNYGQQSLCQVCSDHPRFKTFFHDRIETGLDFCCETAAKLILSFSDKIELQLVGENSENAQPNFIKEQVFKFRQKALEIVQNRNETINERVQNLLSHCNAKFNEGQFKNLVKLFINFERLDKNWGKRVKDLKNANFNLMLNEKYSLYIEQFLANGIYRHVLNAEDTMWARALTFACVLCLYVVVQIFENERGKGLQDLDLFADVARAFSAEVEYSQKNLKKLYNFAYKYIKL